MRKLPVAMVISMIGHGAALAWLGHEGVVLAVPLRVERPHPAATPATPIDAPLVAAPLTVVLIDREPALDARGSPDRAASPVAAPTRRSPGDAPAISLAAESHAERAGQPAIATERASGPEQASTPAHSRWMTMRGAERPSIAQSPGLSSDFLEDFLARSKPVAPPPDIPGERVGDEIADLRRRMRRAGQGQPGQGQPGQGQPGQGQPGQGQPGQGQPGQGQPGQGQIDALRHQLVAKYDERAAEELKAAGGGTYRANKETFTAKVDRDGSVQLEDKPEKLDWQDRIMLQNGADPYARNKLALLDRTRDQRVAVGARHRRAQLGRTVELMQKNIDRLWAMTSDLAARKTGLFELWDDCAETGSEEIVAGATAARKLVVGVIRSRLRDAAAYTPAELAQLNARRRSTAVFAPYE